MTGRDYLWMGTEGGLTRYDGKNFKTFNDHPNLTSYDFNSIYEDSVFENNLFTQEGYYIEMVISDRDDIYVRILDKIVRYLPEQNDYEYIYRDTMYGKMYYLTYAEGSLSVMMA